MDELLKDLLVPMGGTVESSMESAVVIEPPPDVAAEAGCWLQTYTGGVFYPLAPRQQDINIQDIAGALSKLCRYGGHCLRFYSVAEHSVLAAEVAPKPYKLAALLHDASEAYLVDVPRPLKPWLLGYHGIEDRLMGALARKFGFEFPLPGVVKQIDAAILSDERAQNMARMDVDPRLWGTTSPPLGVKLNFWKPEEAQWEFLQAFHLITKN